MKFPFRIPRFITDRRTYIRSVFAETLLEDFFIAAVGSVIAIRFYLQVTGFPQIGGGGIHVAHVLFGGLLMLFANIILLSFLGHSSRRLAAILGGIGFGTFIDELGKFITSDYNYFFEPAIALIYVVFILLFFLIRFIVRRQTFSREEHLANALDIAQHASISGLDIHESKLAEILLKGCEQEGIDTRNLKALLTQSAPDQASGSHVRAEMVDFLHTLTVKIASRWQFLEVIVIFVALLTVTPVYLWLATIEWSWILVLIIVACGSILALIAWFIRRRTLKPYLWISAAIVVITGIMAWAIAINLRPGFIFTTGVLQLIFPSLSGILLVIGLLLIPVSRIQAYKMFARATLISIFFTQLFAFIQYQLFALIGLLINVIILVVLRYMISVEKDNIPTEKRGT